MAEMPEDFARRAREARESRVPKMTQAELAALVGKSVRSIVSFEAGETRPNGDTIERIKQALNMDEAAPERSVPETAPAAHVQSMEFCPTCGQIVVPPGDTDTRTFINVLVVAMDAMTPEERTAFRKRVTRRDVLHLPE